MKGFIVNLAIEPAWMYESYSKDQWGIFIFSIWYTVFLINGIINEHRNTNKTINRGV